MFLLNAPIGAPGLRSPSKKSRGSRLPSRRQPFRSLQQLWHSMLLALPLLWLLKEVGGNYSVGFTVSVNLVVVKLLYTEKQPPKRKKDLWKTERFRTHCNLPRNCLWRGRCNLLFFSRFTEVVDHFSCDSFVFLIVRVWCLSEIKATTWAETLIAVGTDKFCGTPRSFLSGPPGYEFHEGQDYVLFFLVSPVPSRMHPQSWPQKNASWIEFTWISRSG